MKLTPRLKKAIDIAAYAHGTQMRKDSKTPYISHPYGCVVILSEFTDDEDIYIGALLHDVIEDVDPSRYGAEDIERDFGSRVLEIVRGVTEDKSLPTYKEIKQAYLNQLKTDKEESLFVSAADLTHNMRSLAEQLREEGAVAIAHWQHDKAERMWAWEERTKILEERLASPITKLVREALEELKKVYPA